MDKGKAAGAMKGWWMAAALIAAAGVLAAACGGDSSSNGSSSKDVVVVIPSATNRATPGPRNTATPTPSPSPSPLNVCAPNPDPASPKVLQVLEPDPNSQVRVPFHVRGWGSNIGYQDQGLALAIVDAKQNVVQVLNLPAQPREYRVAPAGLDVTPFTRPFAADIVINNLKEQTPYCLWAYQQTTASGAPKGVVQVPVLVLPAQ